jgi:hypothetical protein
LIIDQEKEMKNYELWNNLSEIKSNVEKILKYDLLTKDELEESKNDFIGDFFLEYWEIKVDVKNDVFIDPSKIAGTSHPDYCNKSLYEVINTLKRAEPVIYNYLINPIYYVDNSVRKNHEKKLYIAYKKHEDKYYICGEGNHRFFLSKILQLDRVLVNELYVYDEDVELKRLIEEIMNLGFDLDVKEKSIEIAADNIKVVLQEPTKEDLERFINYYKNINISKWSEFNYKIRLSLINNYREKFLYSDDQIKHIIHFNYLELLYHKRNFK